MRTGLLLLLFCLAPGLAGAVTLKPESTVNSDRIMLSDVFLDVPFEKDQLLASAPAPGRQLIYTAADLAAIARRLGLDWQATSPADRAVITRASQTFDAAAIRDAVSDQLTRQGKTPLVGRLETSLDNDQITLHTPADRPARLEIENLSLAPGGLRFSGIASVVVDGQTYAQSSFSGRLRNLVSVPVPARALRKDDIISASDLGWQDIEMDAASADILTDADDLIGKTPRNSLRPGLPVRAVDLLTPPLITKGSRVTLLYRNNGVQITTAGRALANGVEGETIRVVNLISSRTLEGRVMNSGTVRLGPDDDAADLALRTAAK